MTSVRPAAVLVPVLLVLCAWPAAPALAQAAEPALEFFTRPGCPHCAGARVMLGELARAHPALGIVEHDVWADADALQRLQALAAARGVDMLGVPAFFAGGDLVIGFDPGGVTRARLEALLGLAADAPAPGYRVGGFDLDPRRLGLPLFSAALGLIDGFNPCSMWVLVFMLAMLAPLRDRRRMLLVAGTFVTVEGLAYLAFMAAWLNVFVVIGASQASQVVVGIAGCVVGLIHAKDFFASGRGPSLSIPAAARPGIYARIRRIVTARSASAAVAATVLLAAVVQIVEFMCTAGIPALFTRILTLEQLPTWQYYGYLGIYIAAYMLDDAVVLAIGVVTLSQRRLQRAEGRWLKLVSGGVLVVLGSGLVVNALR